MTYRIGMLVDLSNRKFSNVANARAAAKALKRQNGDLPVVIITDDERIEVLA